MRKVFLMLSISLFSLNAEAACSPTPECASLGYKYSLGKCGGAAIKCPSGEGYYCPNPLSFCSIGDIYYSDKTCTSADNYDSSKTVLGVVVYITDGGKHGQIMAPWPIDADGNKLSSIKKTMMWGGYGKDISGLTNYTSDYLATTDYDSCGNTDKIVAAGDASTYPAAWATRRYAPTLETIGKWCLPAAGIMTNIYYNQTAIQNAISTVGGVSFPNCCTWSSSENDNGWAWYSGFSYSYGLANYTKNNRNLYVRPVLEF